MKFNLNYIYLFVFLFSCTQDMKIIKKHPKVQVREPTYSSIGFALIYEDSIFESKIAVAAQSTLLRNKIGLNEKILSCNFTGHPDVAFPAMGSDFPDDCICIFNEPSYELFEEKVLKILSLTPKRGILLEKFFFIFVRTTMFKLDMSEGNDSLRFNFLMFSSSKPISSQSQKS